jgi:hypothetical protein
MLSVLKLMKHVVRIRLKLSSFFIPDVPMGNVNILESHSARVSKLNRVYMYMRPIPNGFRDRPISLYNSKIVVKKEILRVVSNTVTYCSGDKVGTVYLLQ